MIIEVHWFDKFKHLSCQIPLCDILLEGWKDISFVQLIANAILTRVKCNSIYFEPIKLKDFKCILHFNLRRNNSDVFLLPPKILFANRYHLKGNFYSNERVPVKLVDNLQTCFTSFWLNALLDLIQFHIFIKQIVTIHCSSDMNLLWEIKLTT